MTGANPIWRDPLTNKMVSKKSGKKTRNKSEMQELGYTYEGESYKHKFIYDTSNRKNIIINSRKTDGVYFTNNGQILFKWELT
jgi:hypothetical protein